MKTEMKIEVDLSPDDLAETFINWSDDEQGEFFNLVGKHFKESDFNSEMQVCALSDHIKKDGRDFIYTLANFIKVRFNPGNREKYNMLIDYYKGADNLRRPL